MSIKSISGDCLSCESTYNIEYMEGMVSQDLPEHCPFCGEVIEELTESYIEDEDDFEDDEKWDR
jgi:NAD-dependent SIR2 family protein deacetylase